jgi:ArsR family metal-binding transcriptional regulator
MAQILIFPNMSSFERGLHAFESEGVAVDVLAVPEFCAGLLADSLVISAPAGKILETLRKQELSFSGIIPYGPSRRGVPQGGPLDETWRTILGAFQIVAVNPSFTDPTRLRVECLFQKKLDDLIPYMARFIRGGAFNPYKRLLAFEEEHRLLSFKGRELVICRADDLLDIQVLVRCAIELVLQAWERKDTLEPETKARIGIGSVEIFKRLPGTNCGACGYRNCMELAMELLTSRSDLSRCTVLLENPENRKSLEWLMEAIGLQRNLHSEK